MLVIRARVLIASCRAKLYDVLGRELRLLGLRELPTNHGRSMGMAYIRKALGLDMVEGFIDLYEYPVTLRKQGS